MPVLPRSRLFLCLIAGIAFFSLGSAWAVAANVGVNRSGPNIAPAFSPGVAQALDLQVLALQPTLGDPTAMAQMLLRQIPHDWLQTASVNTDKVAAALIMKRALTEPAAYAAVQHGLMAQPSPLSRSISAGLASLKGSIQADLQAPAAFQRTFVPLERALASTRHLETLAATLDAFFTGSRTDSSGFEAETSVLGQTAGRREPLGRYTPPLDSAGKAQPSLPLAVNADREPSLLLFYSGLALGISYFAVLPARAAGYLNLATLHASNFLWSFMVMSIIATFGKIAGTSRRQETKLNLMSALAILLFNVFHEYITNLRASSFDWPDMLAGVLGITLYLLADVSLAAWGRSRSIKKPNPNRS